MDTPKQLIDSQGQVALGIFDQGVEVVNHLDYDLRTPLGQPASRFARHFGYTQFQFMGLISPEFILGCAIIDTRYVGAAFVYIFHPPTGRMLRHSFKTPLSIATTFSPSPNAGQTQFQKRSNIFQMERDEQRGTHHLVVRLESGLRVNAHFHEDTPANSPMSICTPIGGNGWVYAQKTAAVPVEGTVDWEDGTTDLAAISALGHRDWSAGYMRRETFWNWGCISDHLPDGRRLGLNISRGVNESGFTENCFWVDGNLHKLDSVHFEYDRRDLNKPWRMRSFDGRLDLVFEPLTAHSETINALILASRFHQLVGRFSGTLKTDDETLHLDGLLGYAEEHFSKW